MQRINISFPPVVRPANVHLGTVIRIDGYGKCGADAFLPQGWSVRPRDGDTLNHNPPWQFVRRILQRLERIGTSSSRVVADNDYVTSRNGAVEFSPPKKRCVNGVVARDCRPNGGAILSRSLSRFDRYRLVSRTAIHGDVHSCRVAIGLIEIIETDINMDVSVDGGATNKSVPIEARKT